MKIKGNKEVDEDTVKKFNEETPTWTAICSVCHVKLTGTLPELRAHKHDKSDN